jgi:hypothetical protein
MIDGWNRLVNWFAHANPQPKYKEHKANSAEEFRTFSYNPKTMMTIPTFIKTENAYEPILAYDDAIDTYYTETESIYGYTNLPLSKQETYGSYTFRGFKAENLVDENGEMW